MNAAITTVIAAGVAVIGTLLAPILAQRASAHTKAQEYEFEQRRRQEDRETERRLLEFTELRSTYTELNTEMRDFLRALNNYLHLIRAGHCSDEDRATLEEVRYKYHQHYSDAQMIVSDNVLHAAGRVNGELMQLYGIARRLDNFPSADLSPDAAEAGQETIESAFERLEQVRRGIGQVRDMMRRELGVSSAADNSRTMALLPAEPLRSLTSTPEPRLRRRGSNNERTELHSIRET
jgi:hypothetical protein